MVAAIIATGHDIIQERLRVIAHFLVVQKQLREQAKILRILPLLAAVNFVHGDTVLPVDFVARRMKPAALAAMPGEGRRTAVIPQAEFADQQARRAGQLLRVRRKVPRGDAVLA